MVHRPYRTQPRTLYKSYRQESYRQEPYSPNNSSKNVSTWDASTDDGHKKRVELHKQQKREFHARHIELLKRRRQAKSESSRALSSSNRTIRPYQRLSLFSSQNSRNNTDKYQDETGSSITTTLSVFSSTEDIDEKTQEMVNYYDEQIERYRGGWSRPFDPRGDVGRMEGKTFGKDMAKSWKRFSSLSVFKTGFSLSSLRITDKKHSPEAYCVGTIFSAPYHTASSDESLNVAYDDPAVTASPYGSIFSKFRKQVVIRIFGLHCLVLPIYTHNGKGLDGKRHIEEFACIRDRNDPDPEPKEGVYSILYAEKDTTLKGSVVNGRSCLKLTEVSSHRYDAPTTIEGKLEQQSLLQLLDLVKKLGGI